MRLGISTYTFTWAVGVPGHFPSKRMSARNLIEKAAQLNVACVQIADNMPLDEFSKPEIEEINNLALANNIQIEVGTRKLTIENTLKYLDIAQWLGSSFLRMVIDGKNYHPSVPAIIETMKELIPELEKRNITLAIENHDRLKSTEFAEIIEKSGSKNLGICLDSVNSMGAGEGFEEVMKTLSPYTVNLHVKDFTVKRVSHMMGFEITGTPAGKGMLNIPEMFQYLAQFRKCRSATLELWTTPEESIEKTIEKEERWAIESLNYLKSIHQN